MIMKMRKLFSIVWRVLLLFTLVFGLAACGDRSTSGGATTDTSPPTTPTGLLASALTSTQILLTWTASTDDVAVDGYRINRDHQLLATSETTSYLDSGLTPSTSYCYNVSAYDAAGNVSLLSSTSCTSTPPTLP
jgi:chitodextrinase